MTGSMDEQGAARGVLDGFDQVRIINLPARTDRRRSAVAQLGGLGVRIDGGRVAFHEAVRPADADGFETIGTRGCFLSHLDVLRAARRDGVTSLLLLEDDVGFSRGERAALPAALAALAAEPWDMFHGGSPVASVAAPLTPVAPTTPVLLAHFVAFSGRAIERLVPFLEAMLTRPPGSPDGGPMHVDGAYGWCRAANPDLLAFAATPPVAHQIASRTDIHALRGLDRVPALRPMLALLRAGKNHLAGAGMAAP